MAETIYLAFVEGGHAGLLKNGTANAAATPGKETPFLKSLGRRVQEEEFNQPTAEKLRQELKRLGVHVFNPAPDAKDTPLTERTNFANKTYYSYCSKYGTSNVVAIYVSIHFNALDAKFDGEGKDPSGFSVHIYEGQKNKNSGKLAKYVLDELAKGTKQVNRGIVEQNLHITRETVMPAILTENGFMDNEKEAVLMLNESFQKEVATEHAKGICKYFGITYKTAATEDKPAASKPAVKKDIHRVIVDGKQIGAYSVAASVGDAVEKAVSAGAKKIIIEEV